MNPSTPGLPLDIFYCITDVLACLDDFDTLKMCSMACKELRPLCLRFMFAKIRIANKKMRRPSLPIDQVKDLMERNPTLSRYIKNLKVYLEPTEFNNANFPFILNQLQNLNTLRINGGPHRPHNALERPPIPEPMWISFEHLIRMPSLIDLQLKYMNDFPILWFSAASTSLKDLSLLYTKFPADCTRTIVFGPNPPVLRSFTIALDESFCIVTSFLSSKRPDEFAINAITSGENEEKMYKMYLYVSTKLRSLHLQVDDTSATFRVEFANYIHPLSLKTLEHIKLDFGTADQCDPYYGAPDELAKLMSTGCPLQSLDLEIGLFDCHEYFMNPQVWNNLDILPSFTTLRNISLVIYICEAMPTEADILAKRLSEILRPTYSTLANNPRFEFRFSVQRDPTITWGP
ncbi:hypothetical protein BJ912DRAFT_953604 [Pholiota molesta]|nr:hypothetical protein BJ912DRAFT_953604 [Pholiota molesta]